jgi:glyoxylate reductase
VFVTFRLPEPVLAPLIQECDIDVYEGSGRLSRGELMARISDAEGLLGYTSIDSEILDAAPRLRVISNIAVGFDNVDLAAASSRGILVANTPGVLTDAVADLTIGLIIQLARELQQAGDFVKIGFWAKPGDAPRLGLDLKGKVLSVIGMGRIGVAVATRAQAFGMGVVYCDTRENVQAPSGARAASLDEALRNADFLSIHTNLTADTHHLIGQRELALMKPTAYVVNTARGSVIDQGALTDALKEGRLAGAALDVLEKEPPDPDDPLLGLPNVFVTPHIGSATAETRRAMANLAVQNLLACLRGEACENVVNPEARG